MDSNNFNNNNINLQYVFSVIKERGNVKMCKKKATIYDIAKITGFSPKTVARVINNEGNVKEQTAESVRKVAKELNYVPNRFARNLKTKKDKTVLLSVKTTENFPTKWLQILIERIGYLCIEENITLITEYYYTAKDLKRSIINSAGSIIDGVVIFYEEENDMRIHMLKNQKIPFLIYGKTFTKGAVSIGNNDVDSLRNTFDLLCKEGIKEVLIMLSTSSLINLERLKGIRMAFQQNNIDSEGIKVVYGIKGAKEGYDHVMENIDENELPDVIFVSGDERVPGVYKALIEKNIRIPEDISIIGFDNIPISNYYIPSLTTIEPNYNELAVAIINCIKKIIDNENIQSIEIGTRLIIRDSTLKNFSGKKREIEL